MGQWKESPQSEIFGGFQEVQQVVGSLREFFRSGLGGTDVHAPVGLPAVGVDYLATEALAKVNGQARFAHGGRADDGDQGWNTLSQ